MKKTEYLDRLAWLLSDIPEGEREEALSYYRDYFEDAGEENEAEVIQTLGSPEKVAAMIKEGIFGGNPEAGEYTEQGYRDERYREDGRVPQAYRQPAPRTARPKRNHTGRNLVLIILLCIFAIPVGLPVLAVVFSVFLVFLVVLAAVIIAIGAGAFAALIGGAVLLGLGIAKIFLIPATGFLYTGLGLGSIGVGLVLLVLTVCFFGKAVPALCRGFVRLCQRPFQRGRR